MSTEEPQVAEMAELIRQQQARLRCWDDYAAGICTLAEAEAAARAAGQNDAQITRAAQLFAPFDAANAAAIVSAIERADAGPTAVIRPDVARWRRPALAGAVALAAAAAVLWVTRAPTPIDATRTAAPMVAHELSIRGVAEVRGDAEVLPSVPAGSTLQLMLRPATTHAITPTVWACATQGTTTVALQVTQAPGKPGTTLQVSAPLPSSVTVGTWDLAAFVSSVPMPAGSDGCAVAPAAHVDVTHASFVVR